MQEYACIYVRRCLEKTLEGSFSVDVNATINIQMEHFTVYIYLITSLVQS